MLEMICADSHYRKLSSVRADPFDAHGNLVTVGNEILNFDL